MITSVIFASYKYCPFSFPFSLLRSANIKICFKQSKNFGCHHYFSVLQKKIVILYVYRFLISFFFYSDLYYARLHFKSKAALWSFLDDENANIDA